MNKKCDTNTKYSKCKKHYKSKSDNDKKCECPAGHYKEYLTRRREEGHVARLQINALATLRFEIYLPTTLSEL